MLEEVLDMLCKIVRPLTIHPVNPVILVPEAINPKRELLAMPCKIVCPLTRYLVYPAILILEAINPERVISYAM